MEEGSALTTREGDVRNVCELSLRVCAQGGIISTNKTRENNKQVQKKGGKAWPVLLLDRCHLTV